MKAFASGFRLREKWSAENVGLETNLFIDDGILFSCESGILEVKVFVLMHFRNSVNRGDNHKKKLHYLTPIKRFQKNFIENCESCIVCFLNHLQVPIHLIFFPEGDHKSIPEIASFQTELDLVINISNFPSMNLPQNHFLLQLCFTFFSLENRENFSAWKKNCNSGNSLTFVFRRESHELPLD